MRRVNPANVSKVVDPETGEPRVIGGMFVDSQEAALDRLPEDYERAHELGREMKKRYKNRAGLNAAIREGSIPKELERLFYSGSLTENSMFEDGFDGIDLPSRFVFAERIGDVPPNLKSYNYRYEFFEDGVSVLGLLDPESGLVRESDGMFEIFNRDRKRFYVGGFLLDSRGSDGEPLIIPTYATEKNNARVKSATGNTGAFSRKNDDIRFSVEDRDQTDLLSRLDVDEYDGKTVISTRSGVVKSVPDLLRSVFPDIRITEETETHAVVREGAAEIESRINAAKKEMGARRTAKELETRRLVELARSPDITPEMQMKALNSGDGVARQNLAENPNVALEVQVILAKDMDNNVRYKLAQNRKVTPEAQVILAEDSNKDVRLILANVDGISPEAQMILAKDSNKDVRWNLAENPNITQEVQAILAKDMEENIRRALSLNPSLSMETVGILAEKADVRMLSRLAAKHNTPFMKERAAVLLKEAQEDPEANVRDISTIMNTGLIDIATIKDASFTGISRWRRELKAVLDGTTEADNRLSGAARKLGVQKDALIALIRKSTGVEVADDWLKRDFFSRADLEKAAGKPGLLYLNEAERGGGQAPGRDKMDSAISFFNPDVPEEIQNKFSKAQVASSHPAGFGFALFRRFGKKKENALMTEIQSDIMSVLFDKGKEDRAAQIWGRDLPAAREAMRSRRNTWVKEIFRNTARYLFNHGVRRVYAITPESLRGQLAADPPDSVVNAWLGERAVKEEGFGERVNVEVGGIEYEVWDAIERDSEAGREILFSVEPERRPSRPVLSGNDMNTAFTLLAQFDEAFQQPTPKGRELPGIVREIDEGYSARALPKAQAAPKGASKAWEITAPSGAKAQVYEDRGKVWIDVSRFQPGKDMGNVVYGAVAGYAHNAGKVFIGDPAGLSRTGFYRRLENMISSALRYGTTDHLRPHEAQLDPETYYDGEEEFKGLGIKWKIGDTEGNLTNMMRVAYNAALRNTPKIKDIIYDFDRQQFVDTRTGRSVLRGRLKDYVSGVPGKSSPRYSGGSSTAARAVLFNTFLQGRGRAGRPAPLAAFGGQLRRERIDPELKKVFYSTEPDAPPALPEETPAQAAQRRVQDQFNRFRILKAWAKKMGVDFSEQADVYRAEERMHARFANQVEDFRNNRVRPLIRKIAAAGFKREDVEQFLHAQHAEERNQKIASINQKMPDGGSGMLTAVARAILASAHPELAALANEFRQITEDAKNLLLKEGLITQEMADAWDAAYKHYVPLKGEAENAHGTGKGLKARLRLKRALGHSERDEKIIENILLDYERAVMLAEKNRVGQSLLAAALELGRDDIISVDKPVKRAVLRPGTTVWEVRVSGRTAGSFASEKEARIAARSLPGDVAIRKTNDLHVVYTASPMLADNETLVYVKGHAIRLQINDALLARAYGRMGQEALNGILRAGAMLNRYLSRIYTGYNPEFLLTNIVRDFGSGIINITGKEGAGVAARAARNYPKAFAALLKYAFTGKASSLIARYREDGGNTGAAYLTDLERLGGQVATEFAAYNGVLKNLKAGDVKNAARAAGRKTFGAALKLLENINMAGENAMRLAAYEAMLQSGKTRADAASLAKNATVNFNRKGEIGAQANALYLFFNASVQGTAAAVEGLSGKHKFQAWGLAGAMAGLGYLLASSLGGADDEEEYDRLDDYTKTRNMVIWSGDGWVKIPVPYG
ncbi:MAG: hypothetical protein LBF51_05835, partial [Zoogloeaceae bacterium]|nr:hypothetical protein [Zoogloeaceae bacterium]